jgi:hypothetical protein
MRSSLGRTVLAALLAAAAPAFAVSVTPAPAPTPVPPIAACLATPDPVPSGVTATANAPFPDDPSKPEHPFLTSAIHLQGLRAMVKYAGGLLQNPTIPEFKSFTSAVVVANPDPVQTVTAQIEYFDDQGTQVGPIPAPILTIAPDGFHVEAALPLSPAASGGTGIGSARVTVLTGPGIVGSVLTHASTIDGISNPQPAGPEIGASSEQQLQIVQPKTELWWGPLPLTLTSPVDVWNHEEPFLWVVNPNPQVNKIRIDLVTFDHGTGISTTTVWRHATLKPQGTLLEKANPNLAGPGLWDQFKTWYATLGGADKDVLVHVVSETGLPILGDGIMTDLYGDHGDKKFRLVSDMLANAPNWRLEAPDFTFAPGSFQTTLGLWNTGTSDAGPLTVEYFTRSGGIRRVGTIPSLPANQSVRITSGVANYPPSTTGWGWARITACNPNAKLVGWETTEILAPAGGNLEAFGDVLDGNNGQEPGDGIAVVDSTFTPWVRKAAPIVKVDPTWYWPGYTTFANDSVPNVGPHRYRFFDPAGTAAACNTSGTFGGLMFPNVSTTYEDSLLFPSLVCVGLRTERVDVTTGPFVGMNVLGDPFVEYGIPGFAGVPADPENPDNPQFPPQ